ncbi:MAG: hypothetical protein RLZZ488_712 [Pseudomonadota bacterium]|jgi:hypothetical protein
MKKSLKIAALGLLALAPVTVSLAASNADRVGLGFRKSQEQHPQATETKQYCVEGNARIQAGREKERVGDEAAAQACQSAPSVRTAEEARAETRKIERNPNN